MYVQPIMEKSEYIVAPDGNLYWGENLSAILYPIVSVGEISYFGLTLVLETTDAIFMVDKPKTFSLN